jgi:ketosteroid isomerase-like protein
MSTADRSEHLHSGQRADALRLDLFAWFDRFADCVRRRDLAGAQSLFDDQVVAFGTRNEMLEGLDSLAEKQWMPTWNQTSGFDFLRDTLHLQVSDAGDQAWASGLWTSRGEPGDQPAFERRGRATFAFAWRNGWRCTHSHLSMTPSGSL